MTTAPSYGGGWRSGDGSVPTHRRLVPGAAEADRFEQILFLGTRCSGHPWRPTGRRGSAKNVDARIGELLSWVVNNLHLDLCVDELSCRAFMSRRSLTRHFRAATGTTPYAWILEQRIQLAR